MNLFAPVFQIFLALLPCKRRREKEIKKKTKRKREIKREETELFMGILVSVYVYIPTRDEGETTCNWTLTRSTSKDRSGEFDANFQPPLIQITFPYRHHRSIVKRAIPSNSVSIQQQIRNERNKHWKKNQHRPNVLIIQPLRPFFENGLQLGTVRGSLRENQQGRRHFHPILHAPHSHLLRHLCQLDLLGTFSQREAINNGVGSTR